MNKNKPKPNFFYVNRELLHSDRWLNESFTRGQAWIDLFGLAQFKKGSFRVRGIEINVERGQLAYSQKTLSIRWKWSRGKVKRYLKELENNNDISINVRHQNIDITTLITILKYEQWQGGDTPDSTPDGHQTVHQTDTYNKDKKVKNDKNDKNTVYMSFKKLINKNSRDTDKGKVKIKARLKVFTEKELLQAMENFSKDSWNMEHNSGRGVAWFFHCMDKLTPIIIRNKKSYELLIRPISWLYGERYKNFEIWSGNRFVDIKNITKHKANNLSKYRCYGGELLSTNNHRYFLADKTEKIGKDLRIGNKLLIGKYPDLQTDIDIDSNFAWVLGLFAAEGSAGIYKNNRVQWAISNKDLGVLNKASVILSKIGFEPVLIKDKGDVYKLTTNRNLKAWAKLYENWFYIKSGRNKLKKLKKVPDFIFNADIKAKEMFFNGYYKGDGVSADISRGRYYSFTTNSPILCQGLLMLYSQINPASNFTLIDGKSDYLKVYLSTENINLPKPKS